MSPEFGAVGPADIDARIAIHAADYGLHIRIVRKTADQTVTSSVVLVDDDELFFAIGANEVWCADLFIRGDSGLTADFDFAITAPAGATGGVHWGYFGITPSGVVPTAFGAEIMYGGGNAERWYKAYIVVINGATPGNVLFRWAQNVVNAYNSKVLANSFMIPHRLA